MPLLTLKTPVKPNTVKINLDPNTLERLKNYCAYAHGDLDSAVREALIYVFDRDKGFKTFEQQLRQQPAEPTSSPTGPSLSLPETNGPGAKVK
ncbi:MAG TPA: hypothetical protein VG759_02755 [Candidatus Angelobacter sp.]|jgi:ABC-type oligopeptide transport system substrate-binding subunit|nr:hypothetical protein [Candidatus Angelobacter sp.]